MIKVELLQELVRREPSRLDAALLAVRLSGRHLPLQAGCQELLVRPGLRSRPLGEASDGLPECRGLEGASEEGDLRAHIAAYGPHQATPSEKPTSERPLEPSKDPLWGEGLGIEPQSPVGSVSGRRST